MDSRSWLLALPLLTALSGGLGALSGSFEEGIRATPPWQAGQEDVGAAPQVAPRPAPPPPSDDGESTVATRTQPSDGRGGVS